MNRNQCPHLLMYVLSFNVLVPSGKSIYISIHLHVHVSSSIHLSIQLSIYPSIYLRVSVYLSVCTSIHLSIHLYIYLHIIHLYIYTSVYTCTFIYMSIIHLYIYLSIHTSTYNVYIYMYISIHPSILHVTFISSRQSGQRINAYLSSILPLLMYFVTSEDDELKEACLQVTTPPKLSNYNDYTSFYSHLKCWFASEKYLPI